ncbi:MAG: Crp/Fnr family transcriptional regulator [Actinomycetota bacterium]|nr:Crp/Fnr family transcriptional regulator [Actinomycetota bacterium]
MLAAANFPMLDGLPADVRAAVLDQMVRRRWAAGAIVCREGDIGETLHMVSAGRFMARTVTITGEEAALAVLGPGAVFGEQVLLEHRERRNATIVAIGDAETLVATVADVNELRRNHPGIDRFLIDVLSDRARRLTHLLLEARHVDADSRVLHRLTELADIFADDPEDPTSTVPLRQEDLAAMAGTTRPTVNKVLRVIEKEGLVTLGRGRVDVVDRGRLAERAGLRR